MNWGLCSALKYRSRASLPPCPGLSPKGNWPGPSSLPKATAHPQEGRLPPSAGMLTQLPLNLGKGTEGRLACPGSSSDLPPPRHLRGLAQGAPHSRLWSTPAWASPLQQSQLIVFPTQFSYPHGMVIGLGQNEGRESFLFLATWLGHSDISCLFISPVNLSGCPTLSPLSRKISPFSGRKDSSVSQCLLPIQSWS